MSSFDIIYETVKKIPKGKVATYGQVATISGSPKWSRVVGYALHRNPEPGVIPCHRVVMKDGSLTLAFAFGGENRQRELLESEGVEFLEDGRVDIGKCQWRNL